ncbi:MAG TPA: histidine phosphatase family protein [Euzebyales bacterium]|nr:histidine phosphatase family protein [Euzebyales bacterium]
MTTLLLIRHGVTVATGQRLGGRTQAELSDAGRAQARAVAERLAGLPVRAVYTSPLARTWQTAELIGEAVGKDPVACEGLLEVDYGRWTDRSLKAVARTKMWPVIQARPSLASFPDGETIRRAQLRAADAVEELVARHRRGVIVAVSHADVIKALVAFYLSLPLDAFQRLHVTPASVSVLALSPGGRPVLVRFNDDGPLRAEDFRPPRRTTKAKGKA